MEFSLFSLLAFPHALPSAWEALPLLSHPEGQKFAAVPTAPTVPPCDCLCHPLLDHKSLEGTPVISTEALSKYVISGGKEGLEEK